jgi:hypothetical protein
MNIEEIISTIENQSWCSVSAPVPFDLSLFPSGHRMPEDMIKFYNHIGSAILHTNHKPSPIIVMPIDDFKITTQEMLMNNIRSEIDSEGRIRFYDMDGDIFEDLSNNWYTVIKYGNGKFVSVDFSENSNGYCCKTFWDCYGVKNANPIVAKNFTDLIYNILFLEDSNGDYFWENRKFRLIGDAYDAKVTD